MHILKRVYWLKLWYRGPLSPRHGASSGCGCRKAIHNGG